MAAALCARRPFAPRCALARSPPAFPARARPLREEGDPPSWGVAQESRDDETFLGESPALSPTPATGAQ